MSVHYAGIGNLRAVEEALGHASVATTQRYAVVAQRDLRAVSDAGSIRKFRPGTEVGQYTRHSYGFDTGHHTPRC